MEWTKEKICALSQKDRHNLWNNAARLHDNRLLQMIEGCGLSYSDPAGLKLDSPLGRAIAKIINSATAIAAAIDATERGLPALAGIDPLLNAALKDQYANSYEAPTQAGYLIAAMMRKQGYESSGKQGALKGCVAKTGEIYILIE